MKPILRIAAAFSMVLSLSACASEPGAASVESPPAATSRPNVLWVIWDTVRANRLGVYGHDKPTTPKLDRWAKGARVFEHCASTAGQTLPSTATMFTGLFPAEHGTNPKWTRLEDRFPTIAELFRDSGYRTYLYSANAYLSKEHNFHRGFEGEEHPWDEPFIEEATRIVREKLDPANHAGRLYRVAAGEPRKGDLKSAGALARVGLLDWLEASDDSKPFFTVLNYMEAHLPLVPDRQHRAQLMTEADLVLSYQEPILGMPVWRYTTGMEDLPERRLRVLRRTYDASIAELDHLFFELLRALEKRGRLENTVVALTADHGELLGEHHMLNHQYSVHEPLLRVPLMISHPALVEAGRELGLTHFGGRALNALRLEKSFGGWLREYTPDHTPQEAGLDRFIDLDKGDFVGREAVRRQAGETPARALVTLVVEVGEGEAAADAWGGDMHDVDREEFEEILEKIASKLGPAPS